MSVSASFEFLKIDRDGHDHDAMRASAFNYAALDNNYKMPKLFKGA